ncbi:MAG TPA: hypothetical protein VJ729_09790 [Nitrososphaeraceae archaeon]|nr:hypothetical protein [Nitrososphaeraceae archaeon]
MLRLVKKYTAAKQLNNQANITIVAAEQTVAVSIVGSKNHLVFIINFGKFEEVPL